MSTHEQLGQNIVTKRRCGPCQACCFVLACPAPAPGLPASSSYETCAAQQHSKTRLPFTGLRDEGCGVYASRPGVCAGYACWWLQGNGSHYDRPDRLGLVLDNAGGVLHAREVWAGASGWSARARAVVAAVRLNGGKVMPRPRPLPQAKGGAR